nr:MAG TPA: hypothetical protein [Caudoviricetes sp.]
MCKSGEIVLLLGRLIAEMSTVTTLVFNRVWRGG